MWQLESSTLLYMQCNQVMSQRVDLVLLFTTNRNFSLHSSDFDQGLARLPLDRSTTDQRTVQSSHSYATFYAEVSAE